MNGMGYRQTREMVDLHPATLAIGDHQIGIKVPDGRSQIRAYGLRNVVFLLLEPKGPGQTATVRFDQLHLQAGDQFQKIQRRQGDAEHLR